MLSQLPDELAKKISPLEKHHISHINSLINIQHCIIASTRVTAEHLQTHVESTAIVSCYFVQTAFICRYEVLVEKWRVDAGCGTGWDFQMSTT